MLPCTSTHSEEIHEGPSHDLFSPVSFFVVGGISFSNNPPLPSQNYARYFSTSSYLGQADPLFAHSFTCSRKSVCGMGTGVRPSPGFQPQSTNGVCMCSTICSTLRPPFCFGSLSNAHKSWSLKPSQIIGILGDGRCHPGAPGGT